MAYVAVKGGEKAIAAAHALLAEARRGDPAVPELEVAQIREQLSLAVDRVMAEGSCYDPDLAALALKQARGDVPEAVFLLRAYRTTLPRFAASTPIDTPAMAVRRRVSAAFKDLPGGQMLGPTFDYSHRLFEFGLAERRDNPQSPVASEAARGPMPTIAAVMAEEDLLQPEVAPPYDDAPFDLTRSPAEYPAGRDQRLQTLARGNEGFLLAIAYSAMRGWGGDHPLCGEIRMGEVNVAISPPELGFEIDIADITVTECQMLGGVEQSEERPPQIRRGYGLAFGHNEQKTMSMAIIDCSLSARPADQAPRGAAEDDEFVLSHADSIEASGFVQHLKLPHYVDFQGELQMLRRMRRDWFRAAAERDARLAAAKEAAE
jgi:alpha-D-ribose 1-methylphosphonate 5-triphosphate synthase subunit PhnI